MLTVFYGDQVYGEYTDWKTFYDVVKPGMDVYNGAYVYNHLLNRWQVPWSRCDGTPVLIEDVPAICKAWLLIL